MGRSVLGVLRDELSNNADGAGADKVPATENLLSKLEASSAYRQLGPTDASRMGMAVITVTAKR